MYFRVGNAENEKTKEKILRDSPFISYLFIIMRQKSIIHYIVPITVPEPSLESSPIHKRPQTRNYHFTVGQ
jgi:hypothetical protein